jgi:LysM repeat protein
LVFGVFDGSKVGRLIHKSPRANAPAAPKDRFCPGAVNLIFLLWSAELIPLHGAKRKLVCDSWELSVKREVEAECIPHSRRATFRATFRALPFSIRYGSHWATDTDMRWRIYLFVSLALNVLLALGWSLSSRTGWPLSRRVALGSANETSGLIRTNVIVRRQFFSWREVESDDYPIYIANLRNISCPDQTIRDIIIADVNALYARRRATEIVTADQQWWRAEPDPNVVRVAAAKSRELEQERRALLARLLGAGWESGDLVSLPRPSRAAIPLDGPVLGTLPDDVKQRVEEISVRTQDRLQAYLEARRQAGQPPDPGELARLRQQTRFELAAVLSPLQIEEFLLRYSQNAGALRTELSQLKFFNATPDEFRAVFRATDGFDQQLQLLGNATDANTEAARRSLEEQRLAAIKNTLGPARFQQYQLLHDPAYRDAYAAAVDAGAPESAQALYEINQATTDEQALIRANTNLTAAQAAIKLKEAELKQLTANAQALGQELPPEPPLPPKPPPVTTHVLKPGEGLDFLSRMYGVNPNDLRAANPNLDKLKPGDSVSVPINLIPIPTLPVP